MAKLILCEFGKIETILDSNTNLLISDDNFRKKYIGQVGLISIYESENKAPGKKFAHWHIEYGYLYTTAGDLDMQDGGCKLSTKNSIYHFKFGDFGLSPIDKVRIKLSAFGLDSLDKNEREILKKSLWGDKI